MHPDPWALQNRPFEELAATSIGEGSQTGHVAPPAGPVSEADSTAASATPSRAIEQSALEKVASWLRTPEMRPKSPEYEYTTPSRLMSDEWHPAAADTYGGPPFTKEMEHGTMIPFESDDLAPLSVPQSPLDVEVDLHPKSPPLHDNASDGRDIHGCRSQRSEIYSPSAELHESGAPRSHGTAHDDGHAFGVVITHSNMTSTSEHPSRDGVDTDRDFRAMRAETLGASTNYGKDQLPERELLRIEAMRKMMQDAHNGLTPCQPMTEAPIPAGDQHEANILSQMGTFSQKIREGRHSECLLGLTPTQQEGIDPIYGDTIISEESFRPHSQKDLVQMRTSVSSALGLTSYFMRINEDGSVGPAGNGFLTVQNNAKRGLSVEPTLYTSDSSDEEEEGLAKELPPEKDTRAFYRVAYGINNLMPPSGLIRDAVPPAWNDFSDDAQVYRAAVSNAFPFSFAEHWEILRSSILDGRVAELNKRLAAGLVLDPGTPLLRDLRNEHCVSERHRQMVAFANTGLQRRINWRPCDEHYKLLQSLDWNVPDLDLEAVDSLVKAAGGWIRDISPSSRRRRAR